MFNFITVTLFVAVLATSFNPQLFQSVLLKKQLTPATVEKVGKKADAGEAGMMQQAFTLASNGDMVKVMLQSSAKELRQRYTKEP